jgi:hypothetical protein
MTYDSIDDLTLICILKTRHQDEGELWQRFQKTCDRQGVLAMWDQLRESLKRLKAAGTIEYVKGKGVRRLS